MITRLGVVNILLSIFILVFLVATPIYAADMQGEIVQGRFLVPMRGIFEDLGANVVWDGNTRTVTGKKGNTSIILTIDSNLARVNGENIKLDVPATIIKGRTFVPTRFVSEALGADVKWDEVARVATITHTGTVIKVYETIKETGQTEKAFDGSKSTKACPANGTWVANTEQRAFITPPTLSVGKLVVKDWQVEIYPVRWENTGISTNINYGGTWTASDYRPVFTGQVIHGYIDPTQEYRDSNGNIRYHGITTENQELRFWDYQVPGRVYLNIDFFKNDKWAKETLLPN